MTCTICPKGKYCADGVTATTASKEYPAHNTQEIYGEVACAAGYSCSKTLMTKLSAGDYSLNAQWDGTE